MKAEKCRFFVGNLPQNVSSEDVADKFRKYGRVDSVELKHKKEQSSDSVISTFCYVNLETDASKINSCIQNLNGLKWGNQYLKVDQAKESFLQRLQRERQESAQSLPKQACSKSSLKTPIQEQAKTYPQKIEVSKFSFKNRRMKDTSSSSSSDSDEEEVQSYGKLPMFQGTRSFQDSNGGNAKPLKSQHHSSSRSEKESNQRKLQEHSGNSLQVPEASRDVLKKFESFSDVWRDADEYPTQSPRASKFTTNREANKKTKSWAQNEGLLTSNSKQNISEKSEAACAAEKKRLKSLEEKRRAFENQKNAVKSALSDQGFQRVNKKVIFDDDDDGDNNDSDAVKAKTFDPPSSKTKLQHAMEYSKQAPREKDSGSLKPTSKKGISLFNDSGSESGSEAENGDGAFRVKKQFEGAKGKKLLDLQSRFNNDSRFTMDERFYDSDEENVKSKKSKPQGAEQPDGAGETEEDIAAEREQQLQILSSILGQPVDTSRPSKELERKAKSMLRFDPSKPNHQKFELLKEAKVKKSKKRKVVEDENEEVEDDDEDEVIKRQREEKEPEPVSKETFYTMSDSLADTLKKAKEGQSSGFSLLQMFGPTPESGKPAERGACDEARPLPKMPRLQKAFLDESSDEEIVDSVNEKANEKLSSTVASKPGSSKAFGGVWQESFFFQPDDDRFKDMNDFFNVKEDSLNRSQFTNRREGLKKIVQRKMKISQNNANSFKSKIGGMRKPRPKVTRITNMRRGR